ncbi:phospholipase D-like domain-containing protein [Urbifossiella limnaea]|uniref:Phospholipase D-like domain-containing protein n=1 Tax=Urbifossiella limnaea TaxID=2528023 RepID=A0A517XW33_9BACT|nr:phospholipase D-like domain-containing protein [Urbifossiella limnaea]QDU21697.1 hypothetical protein ETAA1_36700 [Urbifossiella limnaea]
MPVKLLYHKLDGAVSPFDKAVESISAQTPLRITCPYLSLGYLQGMLRTPDWQLLTDVEEWLRTQSSLQRERIVAFLRANRPRVRHYPRLHAKVVIGSSSAMLGSANLTDAGIRQRVEVSILFTSEPEVEELIEWFDATWKQAPPLDKEQMRRIVRFANSLPTQPVVVETPPPAISPPLHNPPAPLTRRAKSIPPSGGDLYVNFGHEPGWREWEDARQYGFVCAGGGNVFSAPLFGLNLGDRIWVYAPRYGYVGVGRVAGSPKLAKDFQVSLPGGKTESLDNVLGPYANDKNDDPNEAEHFVAVRWLDTRPISTAYRRKGLYSNRNIVTHPDKVLWPKTLKYLVRQFPNCDD